MFAWMSETAWAQKKLVYRQYAYPVFSLSLSLSTSSPVLTPSVSIPFTLCSLHSTYLFLISSFSLPFSLVLAQHKQQLRMTLPSPWQPSGPVYMYVCVEGGYEDRAERGQERNGWRRREKARLFHSYVPPFVALIHFLCPTMPLSHLAVTVPLSHVIETLD